MTSDRAPILRATVVGTSRSADLALPTDQPLAGLITSLLDLLEEPTHVGRMDLVTPSGAVLDPSLPLRRTAVRDGDILRLVRVTETPPAPLVHEMIELTEHAGTRGRWSTVTRGWVLSLVGLLLVAVSTNELVRLLPASHREGTWWALAGTATVLAIGARLLRALPAAWTLLAGAATAGGLAVTSSTATSDTRVLLGAGVGAVTLAVAGWCGTRLPAALTTAGCALVVAAAWITADAFALTSPSTATVVGVTALVVLGLLPRVALTTSGMLRLDARVSQGRRAPRATALHAVSAAHWALAGGLFVVASAEGWAVWTLARHTRLSFWPSSLAIALSLAAALRARHFPLAVERFALWAAASTGALALALAAGEAHPDRRALLLALVAVAGAALIVASHWSAGDVSTAQARRAASRLESAVVVLSLPLAVGVFGIYGDLLSTFR